MATYDDVVARYRRYEQTFIALKDHVAMARIVEAAQRCEEIVLIRGDRRYTWATAKSLVDADGQPLADTGNLIDAYLRVEVTRIVRPRAGETRVIQPFASWAMRDLMPAVEQGRFLRADDQEVLWMHPPVEARA